MTRIAIAALLFGSIIGCGTKGGGQVSGTVTFADKPVKAGKIYFDPATDNPNGQQGHADIVDGKYDTAVGGKGLLPGKYIARVDGLAEPTDAYPGGLPLFKEFKQPCEITGEVNTVDVKVPQTAAIKLPKNPGTPP